MKKIILIGIVVGLLVIIGSFFFIKDIIKTMNPELPKFNCQEFKTNPVYESAANYVQLPDGRIISKATPEELMRLGNCNPCPLETIYVSPSNWEETLNRSDIYERDFCTLQNNGKWVVFKFIKDGGIQDLYYI